MQIQCPFKIPDHQLRPADFYHMISTAVRKYGNRLALIDGVTGWSCSYDQIEGLAFAFREYYAKLGITSESRPAMVGLNCPEIVFTQIAASLIGCDLIHISPLATVDELSACLTTAKCDAILTQPEHRAKMEQVLERVPTCKRIIMFPEQGSLRPVTNQKAPSKPVRLGHMVFFSSGTTGPPKAFQVPLDLMAISVAQACAAPWNRLDEPSEQERTLIALPLMHNYAATAVYFALCQGHASVIIPRFTPERFLVALEKFKITYLYLVPPLVSFLANDESVSRYDLSHLHSISSGAAPLPPGTAAKCKERLRLKDVRQLYGMTEIRLSTWTPYGLDNYASIGIPLPGAVIKFVDPDNGQTAAKPYEQGEMWVSGSHTGGTYFNNDRANRETFVFEDGVTWTKTGDIGYFDELGFIYLTDRQKDLIKYKGMQVSPAEIEAILRKHPDVVDCAVIGKADEQAGEVPIAFVKRKQGSSVSQEELKQLVKSRLSSFKQLAGGVIFIDELPRSNTGKILKRQLRELLPQYENPIAHSKL